MKQKRVVVIGGGFAGLATAALLAKRGYQVTLFEKNRSLGGRARVFKKKGFQFDMGPSWYMMPEIFDRFFSHFGKKTQDFYTLIRLIPSYSVFFEKAKKIVIPNSITATKKLFERIEPGAGKKLSQYLDLARRQYELATHQLIYQDLSRPKNWLKLSLIPQLIKLLVSTKLWQNWADHTRTFFTDDRLQKIITFPAVFLGGSPFMTPSVFSLLSWADFGKGIWYPKGGMIKVVEALRQVCIENGVKIVLKADVQAVKIVDQKVTAVQTQGAWHTLDTLVVTGDLAHFELKLLPRKYQTYPAAYWDKKTLGISAVLLYIGLNKKLKNVLHHTLYFSDDWGQNFAHIFKDKKIPTNPSFYVSIRSLTDTSIVPTGAEEVVVLIPVASRLGLKRSQYQKLSSLVMTKLEELFNQKFVDSIVVKEMFTPNDFQTAYHAHQGTALGLAHTLFQSFIFRPGNKSEKLSNVYYAGQYTNPGIGVPMALVSAEIVADLIGAS